MTKQSTGIQQLVREYRNTRSPAQVSVDYIHACHNSVTTNWFTPGRAGFAIALSIAALVFIIANMQTQPAYIEHHIYPSISLLSDAGISLNINTDSPDMSDIDNMPGLMNISVPDNLIKPEPDNDEQQTRLTKPHLPANIT
jgi:hypothetical protein